jgi:hypothetical protein
VGVRERRGRSRRRFVAVYGLRQRSEPQ